MQNHDISGKLPPKIVLKRESYEPTEIFLVPKRIFFKRYKIEPFFEIDLFDKRAKHMRLKFLG